MKVNGRTSHRLAVVWNSMRFESIKAFSMQARICDTYARRAIDKGLEIHGFVPAWAEKS